jgi:tetratricopeptide (TPR) repeat protein
MPYRYIFGIVPMNSFAHSRGWLLHAWIIALGVYGLSTVVPCYANGRELLKNAIAAEAENDVDAALLLYSAAIEAGDLSNGKLARCHYARAGQWARHCENGRAIADYTKCIELAPQHGPAYSLRGYLRGISGQYDLAEEDQQIALKLAEVIGWNDYLPWVQQHHADLWRRRGEFDKALKICDQALEKSDYPTIYFRRAWIHLERKDFASAKTDFESFQRERMKQEKSIDTYWPDERIAFERLKRNAER